MFSVEQLAANSLVDLYGPFDSFSYLFFRKGACQPSFDVRFVRRRWKMTSKEALFFVELGNITRYTNTCYGLGTGAVPATITLAIGDWFRTRPGVSLDVPWSPRRFDYIFDFDIVSLFVMWSLGDNSVGEGDKILREMWAAFLDRWVRVTALSGRQNQAVRYLSQVSP